VHIWY